MVLTLQKTCGIIILTQCACFIWNKINMMNNTIDNTPIKFKIMDSYAAHYTCELCEKKKATCSLRFAPPIDIKLYAAWLRNHGATGQKGNYEYYILYACDECYREYMSSDIALPKDECSW